jgi:hypothetical protein
MFAINPSPKKIMDLLGRQFSASWVPTNELGPNSENGTSEKRPSNWNCRIARDCGWSKSMVCRLQFQNAERNKRDTDLLTKRYLGWASIRHCILISAKTYSETPGKQMKRIEKNTYSQTGRLEKPEELQLHHNHIRFHNHIRNSCFLLCILSFFPLSVGMLIILWRRTR